MQKRWYFVRPALEANLLLIKCAGNNFEWNRELQIPPTYFGDIGDVILWNILTLRWKIQHAPFSPVTNLLSSTGQTVFSFIFYQIDVLTLAVFKIKTKGWFPEILSILVDSVTLFHLLKLLQANKTFIILFRNIYRQRCWDRMMCAWNNLYD